MTTDELKQGTIATLLRIADRFGVPCVVLAVVMYFGRVIECAPAQQVFNAPRHPYTKSLIAAVPTPPASPAIRAARPARPDPAPPAPPPNPPLALRDCSRR